jgi:hypothetical protein
MKGSLTALFLTVFAAPSLSSTIYLKCEFEEIQAVNVTLNEETNNIVHQFEDGDILEVTGGFTAESVSYKGNYSVYKKNDITMEYSINRVDLSIMMVFTIRGGTPIIREGTCKVVDVPKKRAF